MPLPPLVEVAALVPLRPTLTYRLTETSPAASAGLTGCRVMVPLSGRRVVGVVVGIDASLGTLALADIKPVTEVLDDAPIVDEELLDFLRWIASYYLVSLGEVLRAALPAAVQGQEQQRLRLTEGGARALAAQGAILRTPDDDLKPDEAALLSRLERSARGLSLRSLGGRSSALARLIARGFVAQTMHQRGPSKMRTDLILALTDRAADDEEVAALTRRAPRQAALLEAVRDNDGRVVLGSLEPGPPNARALAQKLAARELLTIEEVEIPRDPFAGEPVELDRKHRLTDAQQQALSALLTAGRAGQFAGFLLHGVTGSGKTEVYLRLIADSLQRDRSALVLVPEISLTPQLAARFRARFGNQVAVLHSGLTDAERYDQWRLIRSGQVRIAVGARSAVFAPLSRLGTVIVDEEHDGSFKQADGVRYNARDLALVRAKRNGAVCVLGSATPSLESRYGVDQGRLTLLTMPDRATPKPLPRVDVIDLRVYRTGPDRILSAPLAQALTETLERGEQAILFLNRRGFSPFVICRGCGYVFRCEHCSVSLTHHNARARLICHYCGYAASVPDRCPACSAAESVGMLGLGTERVEQHLVERFSTARVARLDRDTASGKGLRAILSRVTRREIDILVGTQMVTKGHDFPHVTLVGVICADLGLHFPDFRAGERTFQLLTQVAGRAGRGERAGRVLIQAYDAQHPSVHLARTHDYEAFYRQELEARADAGYPPCAHLVAVRVDGPDAEGVAARAQELARIARRAAQGAARAVTLLGPAEAPVQRIKGRSRWLLLLKCAERAPLRHVALAVADDVNRGGSLRVAVDMDPVHLL